MRCGAVYGIALQSGVVPPKDFENDYNTGGGEIQARLLLTD